MKVLVLINLYPPHSLGGYEFSCQDVVRRWRAAGHEVSVLTTSTRFDHVVAEDTEIGVHRDLEWYWADHQLQRPPPRERLAIERANQRRLNQCLAELRPDVVSLWAMGGMSMGLVSQCVDRGVPMVAVIGDDWLTYGTKADAWTAAWGRRTGWQRALGAAICRVPTSPPELPAGVPVAFASEFLRQRARTVGTIRFTTSDIVPPGVDPVDFPLRESDDRQWRGRLLCVGRVEERKGFEVVVRALVDLPGTTLRLAGPSDGHLEDLLDVARSIGVADRITTGAVPRDQLAAVYRDADVLVFPSRWEEPFGLVPIEAMTQATPVVATRRGGSAEFLVDGTNCLEIAADDVAEVAGAVSRLAADPELRHRLARNGLATAASYDVTTYAATLETIHESAVAVP